MHLRRLKRQGTLLLSNGKSYAGEFKDDVMHGRGVFKWLDGRRYEGDYKVRVPRRCPSAGATWARRLRPPSCEESSP